MKKYIAALILSMALIMPGCSTVKSLALMGPRVYIATTFASITALEKRYYLLEIPFAFAIDTALLPISIFWEVISLIKK